MGVGNGTIILSQAPDADGNYARNTELSLVADTGGLASVIVWSGVDTEEGNAATVKMFGPRDISILIVPPRPTPTPYQI